MFNEQNDQRSCFLIHQGCWLQDLLQVNLSMWLLEWDMLSPNFGTDEFGFKAQPRVLAVLYCRHFNPLWGHIVNFTPGFFVLLQSIRAVAAICDEKSLRIRTSEKGNWFDPVKPFPETLFREMFVPIICAMFGFGSII